MNVVKTVAGFACGITILLLVLAFTIKKPETALYEETVEMLMKQEGLTSDREIEDRFPKLIHIQANMARIADLNEIVLSKTQGPAPILTEEEALQLKQYMQRVRQLRKECRIELSRLVATNAQDQP